MDSTSKTYYDFIKHKLKGGFKYRGKTLAISSSQSVTDAASKVFFADSYTLIANPEDSKFSIFSLGLYVN